MKVVISKTGSETPLMIYVPVESLQQTFSNNLHTCQTRTKYFRILQLHVIRTVKIKTKEGDGKKIKQLITKLVWLWEMKHETQQKSNKKKQPKKSETELTASVLKKDPKHTRD